MQPHNNFFSSLNRLEKRLKLETQTPQQEHQESTSKAPNQQQTNIDSQTESMGSPLYLNHPTPTSSLNPTSNLQESEPPLEFLTNSTFLSPIQENPDAGNPEKERLVEASEGVSDIEMLMQLLGLEDEKPKGVGFDCGNDERFYGKIVGVKGPKSEKEEDRLNGWIKHFMNKGGDDGIKQPLRLAYLLLAKASFVHSDDDYFEGLEFPSTVEEFLQHDPPD